MIAPPILKYFEVLNIPYWLWVLLIFVPLSLVQFWNFHNTRKRRDELDDQLTPKIRIEWEHGSSFSQSNKIDHESVNHLFRIRVVNQSKSSMQNVKVKLHEIKTYNFRPHSIPFLAKELKPMSGQSPFELNPGESEFIDVVSKVERGKFSDDELVLQYADASLQTNTLSPTSYFLIINASAANSPPGEPKIYNVAIKPDGDLEFNEVQITLKQVP